MMHGIAGRTVLLAAAALLAVSGCGPRMPGDKGPPLPLTAPAEPFTHSLGMKFVLLPVGIVHGPRVDTELRRPLLISACEITNAQYEQFDPKHERSKKSPGDNHPVNNVTAQQAEAFCKWLTENDAIGRQYKLPDLGDWEYAARGGVDNELYPCGDTIDPTKACYEAEGTRPVGSYPPNKFGLYDMAGNVAEWVRIDDVPPYRLRGGAWCDRAKDLEFTATGRVFEKDETLDHQGFRVICEPPLLRRR